MRADETLARNSSGENSGRKGVVAHRLFQEEERALLPETVFSAGKSAPQKPANSSTTGSFVFRKKLLVEIMLFLKGLLQFLILQEENCMLL